MSGDEEGLRRLQMAPERIRLQKLNQALEDGMVEARFLTGRRCCWIACAPCWRVSLRSPAHRSTI
jgi:hypothetical protein